jgi:hypothetical protein
LKTMDWDESKNKMPADHQYTFRVVAHQCHC